MTVYVDDMEAPVGRMKMCHMIADTRPELLAMASRIGVAEKWLQQRGTAQEHFDISKGRRSVAVAAGAKEITMRALAAITYGRRDRRYRGRYMGTTPRRTS